MRRGNIPEPVERSGDSEETVQAPPARPAAAEPELRTVFDFELPRGYVDKFGNVHKRGQMRLATARDELSPMWDERVRKNPAFLTIALLSRVVIKLGAFPEEEIDTFLIESLFATDLAFLQDLYRRINTEGHTRALVACPKCGEQFAVDTSGAGQRSQM